MPDVDVPDVQVPDARCPTSRCRRSRCRTSQAPEVQVRDLPAVDEPEVTLPDVQTPDVAPAAGADAEAPAAAARDGRRPAPRRRDRTARGIARSARRRRVRPVAAAAASASAPASTAARHDGGRAPAAPASAAATPSAAAGDARAAPAAGWSRDRTARACRRCPPGQRRVLVLRAGVGARDPRTRGGDAPPGSISPSTWSAAASVPGSGSCAGSAADAARRGAGGTLTVAESRRAAIGLHSPDGSAVRSATVAGEPARRRAGRGIAVARGAWTALMDAGRAPSASTPADAVPRRRRCPPGDGELFAYVLAGARARLLALLGNRRSRDWILRPRSVELRASRKAGAAGMGGKRRPLGRSRRAERGNADGRNCSTSLSSWNSVIRPKTTEGAP